jgi:hypothetical protein
MPDDTAQGTVQQPLEEAMAATRRAVIENGYSELETSGPATLMFKKSSGALPVDRDIVVQFEELSPTATRLTVTATTEAHFDYGRSKRASHGVLEAVGAQYDETS